MIVIDNAFVHKNRNVKKLRKIWEDKELLLFIFHRTLRNLILLNSVGIYRKANGSGLLTTILGLVFLLTNRALLSVGKNLFVNYSCTKLILNSYLFMRNLYYSLILMVLGVFTVSAQKPAKINERDSLCKPNSFVLDAEKFSEGPITEQPSGKSVAYRLEENTAYSLYSITTTEAIYTPYSVSRNLDMEVIYADDGETVWIKNLIPDLGTFTDVWVKGTVVDDGRRILVPAGQILRINKNIVYYLYPMGYEKKNDLIYATYEFYDEPIPFVVDGDELRLDYSEESNISVGVVMYNSDRESLQIDFLGMSAITFKRLEQHKAQMPVGLETKDYVFQLKDSHDNTIGEVVKVGIDGDSIYISGLFNELWPFDPVCIKGTFDGTKAVFPLNQLLFLQNGEWRYLYASKDSLILEYNRNVDMFTSNCGILCCYDINGERVEMSDFIHLDMSLFEDKPAVPASPEVMYFKKNDTRYSESHIYVLLQDNMGGFIDRTKIFVKIYLDGEPYVLTTEIYPELENDIDEIPYGIMLTDNFESYISTVLNQQYIQIRIPGDKYYKRICAQTIYYGGGERHMSDIVCLDNQTSDIQVLTAEKTVKDVKFYTLSGSEVTSPVKGVYIKKIIFTNGTSESTKIFKE